MYTAITALESCNLVVSISAFKKKSKTAAHTQLKSSKDSLVKALCPWRPQEQQTQQHHLDWTSLSMGRSEDRWNPPGHSQESPRIPSNSVPWGKWPPSRRPVRGSSKILIFLNKNCICPDWDITTFLFIYFLGKWPVIFIYGLIYGALCFSAVISWLTINFRYFQIVIFNN